MSPLLSCVCVTRNRVRFLKRAVKLFFEQTYPEKELIICYDWDDPETAQYLESLTDPRIIKVLNPSKLSLGFKRNLALESCSGEYIACWDDDDWSASNRLEVQMEYLEDMDFDFCMISRSLLYSVQERKTYEITRTIGWMPCTLVTKRSALLPYTDQDIGEDRQIRIMIDRSRAFFLNLPEIFVYTSHGDNIYLKSLETCKSWMEFKPFDIKDPIWGIF